MASDDLFNIDSKCQIGHCSILVLCSVIAMVIVVGCVVWCCCRKCNRRVMVERQGEGVDVQIQVQSQPSQVLRTEESLQPRGDSTKKLAGVLGQEMSSQQLYKFEDSNAEEETKEQTKSQMAAEVKKPAYLTELMRQIEVETMEIQKISIRRKRRRLIQKPNFFAEAQQSQNANPQQQPIQQQSVPQQLDTIQQEVPSLYLSSIEIRPGSPISFSFVMENRASAILQHPNQTSN